MPTYEYVCANDHAFERIQKMNDKPVTKCPECGAKAARKISGGQGLIFKGSGFYITDYGKDGKGPRKHGEGAASMPDSSAASTRDSKSDSKSDSKPEPKSESTPKADAAPKPEKKSSSHSTDAS
jgi:putative FmdB family regulatory protein